MRAEYDVPSERVPQHNRPQAEVTLTRAAPCINCRPQIHDRPEQLAVSLATIGLQLLKPPST